MFALGAAKPLSGAAQIQIHCPVEAVFNFVGHGFFENYARWSPQVVELEKLSDGPVRAGATGRQTTLDRGILSDSTFEVARFDPPRLISLKGLSEHFSSHYAFEAQSPEATLLTFSFTLDEREMFLRPFAPLIRARLREGAQRTVENLRQLLEGDHMNAKSRERLARFIYVASLDLQEPLRRIEAFSELLENAVASSNKTEIAYAREAMRDCALSARKLVDDLFVYSCATLDEQNLEILDLSEEIQAALATLEEQIATTRADINLRLGAGRVMADRSQFACLMQNIISNAIKYRKAGQSPRIDISACVDGGVLRLAIADDGVGFDEEFARTIFEPFDQPRRDARYCGTGIELAICKSIADRHGWEISVKSRPGEGTTFFFTMPALHSPPARETPAEARRATARV